MPVSTPDNPGARAPARPRRPGRPPGPDPRRGEKLEAILDGACRALVDRGLPATRIADVAAAAGVSTGTVHYYFATKDEVLVAALKYASRRLYERARAAEGASATQRLARLLSVSVPRPGDGRDEYVLWAELWVRMLHQPELVTAGEEISERWRGLFHAVVRDGAAAGEFDPVGEPGEVADRLVAMVDGLGFESAVGYHWTSPERVHARLLDFASEQLRVARAALTEERG